MDSAVKLYHLSFHTTFEGLVKAVLRKLLIDSNVWYVFIPSAILVIFSGVIIPMLLYRFVLKNTGLQNFYLDCSLH